MNIQQGRPTAAPAHGGGQGSAEEDLQALFGRSTVLFASMSGPEHVVEAANPAFFQAIGGGERERTGLPIGQLMPELAEQGFTALLDEVYRTGLPYAGRSARALLGGGGRVREAFFDFSYEPRRDPDGGITGVRMLGVETTQVKQAARLAAEHRALLEQIARQAPLEEVLDGMARAIEDLSPDVIVSVLLADEDGRHLRHGAAPSLPGFYNEAIDGIATGEGVGSCGTAAHRREPVIVTDIGTDPFWDDFRDLAGRARLASCWSTPILARDGSLLGTFAMYHRTPRAPQEADLALSRVFTDTAALAVERHRAEQARLAAEAKERAARDDLAFLLRAGTALAEDLDYTQTMQRLVELASPALAPLCAVDAVDAGRVRRIAAAGPTPAHTDLLAAAPVTALDAEADVFARVLASGVTEVARRAPAGPGPWTDLAVTGYVCTPLVHRGRPFATLTLFATGDGALDGHTVALAEELARRASTAAGHARQYTQRATLARDLQAGLLLPDPPELPGAELALHYHPAGEGLDIGGDFYDAFPLPDGTWAFMLGDVCGRGAHAATTTALVRHTARAVAPLLPDPASVVHAVNRALLERPGSHGNGFVTLVYGQLRPAEGRLALELVRAGHPGPLVLDPVQGVRPLDIKGALLGISRDLSLQPHHVDLHPGQSLVLFTDGITEARDSRREQFGDARVAEALSGVAHPDRARDVLDGVITAVGAFTGDDVADDDQAVLVLTATRP
ncbi:SpoIIE family protein phosphatase [Streptomyces sp. cmx-4-9]|uniref:SpoIIE family protein phosphatase n=1 Tax=Streptomyces sp. cmx-4-9 TaxID=2790941 RepID=UPI00397F04C7